MLKGLCEPLHGGVGAKLGSSEKSIHDNLAISLQRSKLVFQNQVTSMVLALRLPQHLGDIIQATAVSLREFPLGKQKVTSQDLWDGHGPG